MPVLYFGLLWYTYNPSCHNQVITNSNNSYEYVGTYHNQGVASIFGNMNASTQVSQIQSQTNVFLQSKGYDTVQCNLMNNYSTQFNYKITDTAYATNPNLLTESLRQNNQITQNCYIYLNKIFACISSNIGSNAPTSAIYSKFANAEILIENAAKNDVSVSAQDLQCIMSVGSVSRNSFCYWANYQLGSSSTGGTNGLHKKQLNEIGSGKQMDKVSASFSWKKVGQADVAGAVAGCVVGAFGGLYTGGPAGVAAGAIGGALSWGVGSSVFAGVMQLFH